jgi:opacity protein-like surface antigen
MKKLASLLTITAVTAFTSIQASAQSAFEGAYGQVGIGYENVTPSFSGGTIVGRGYNISAANSNSFVGTATLGYNFALTPSFLLGLGAEYSPFAGSNANFTLNVPSVPYSASAQYNKQNSYNIFVSPGFAIDKDKLAYAKVGFTGANVNSSGGGNNSLTGYSLGIGYKQIISGGLYGFGEVNYASYSNVSIGGGASGTFSATSTNLLAGIGYKF